MSIRCSRKSSRWNGRRGSVAKRWACRRPGGLDARSCSRSRPRQSPTRRSRVAGRSRTASLAPSDVPGILPSRLPRRPAPQRSGGGDGTSVPGATGRNALRPEPRRRLPVVRCRPRPVAPPPRRARLLRAGGGAGDGDAEAVVRRGAPDRRRAADFARSASSRPVAGSRWTSSATHRSTPGPRSRSSARRSGPAARDSDEWIVQMGRPGVVLASDDLPSAETTPHPAGHVHDRGIGGRAAERPHLQLEHAS